MNCPMCGEPWNDEQCQECGWKEPPRGLSAIVETVLAYKPKPRSKPAKRRKRRAAKIAKGGS
jgi:hypothetical protein